MNKKILGIGILFVLLAAGTVMAFRGNFTGTEQGFDSDAMEQIRTAIENNDFQAWKQIHENNLTEENFNAIKKRTQERVNLMEERNQAREEIQTAIQNGDYTAWKTLMEENNNPRNEEMLSAVNEENFHLFSEMHNAMQSGDFDSAQQIREELGLEQGFKGMNNMNQFQKNYRNTNFVDSDGDGICDNSGNRRR